VTPICIVDQVGDHKNIPSEGGKRGRQHGEERWRKSLKKKSEVNLGSDASEGGGGQDKSEQPEKEEKRTHRS